MGPESEAARNITKLRHPFYDARITIQADPSVDLASNKLGIQLLADRYLFLVGEVATLPSEFFSEFARGGPLELRARRERKSPKTLFIENSLAVPFIYDEVGLAQTINRATPLTEVGVNKPLADYVVKLESDYDATTTFLYLPSTYNQNPGRSTAVIMHGFAMNCALVFGPDITKRLSERMREAIGNSLICFANMFNTCIAETDQNPGEVRRAIVTTAGELIASAELMHKIVWDVSENRGRSGRHLVNQYRFSGN